MLALNVRVPRWCLALLFLAACGGGAGEGSPAEAGADGAADGSDDAERADGAAVDDGGVDGSGNRDASAEGGPVDGGGLDSGAIDSGAADSGAIDSGAAEGGARDGGAGTIDASVDAAGVDAGTDASTMDAAPIEAAADACVPQACNLQCGSIPDGCGRTLSCGGCTGAQTCGGGGTPNVCGCPGVVGCDGVCNSGRFLDSCDVCGGNGSTCAGCNPAAPAPNPGAATLITVNALADVVDHTDALLTLREGLAVVNAGSTSGLNAQELAQIESFGNALGAGGYRVVFATSLFAAGAQSIVLDVAKGALAITAGVTIAGPGASVLTLSGNQATQVLAIDDVTVTISDVTIANGVSFSSGANILANMDPSKSLSLTNVVVTGGSA